MRKTVLITGCSSGIGLATAKMFAAKDWNVVAAARNPRSLGDWSLLANVLPLHVDVTDEASIQEAISAAITRFGQIDVLVNNAGDEAQFRPNVFGPAAMIRNVLPLMRQQKRGTIVNLSTVSGRVSASESALRAHGIRVKLVESAESVSDPKEVAQAIFNAATDESARLRYPVGGWFRFVVRAILLKQSRASTEGMRHLSVVSK